MKIKVWILMDSSEKTGQGSIIGVYDSENLAKYQLAEYVLRKSTGVIDYIEIFGKEIETERKQQQN